MSALAVVSLSPAHGEVDVVLGRVLEILFDRPVDPASVSDRTFSLMGPGQPSLVEASSLIRQDAHTQTGREYIPGTFSYPAPAAGDAWLAGQKLLFTPARPLRPSVTYTVLLAGQGSLLAQTYVRAVSGEALAPSLQYTFSTGILEAPPLPLQCPVPSSAPWERPVLAPTDILVRPRGSQGLDLAEEIVLVFPGPIDPSSFNPEDVVIAGEPFLNDPDTVIPASVARFMIEGNTLRIRIDWNAAPPARLPMALRELPGLSGPAPDATDAAWLEPEGSPFVHPE